LKKVYLFTTIIITTFILNLLDNRYNLRKKLFAITHAKAALKFVLFVTNIIIASVIILFVGKISYVLEIIFSGVFISIMIFFCII